MFTGWFGRLILPHPILQWPRREAPGLSEEPGGHLEASSGGLGGGVARIDSMRKSLIGVEGLLGVLLSQP
jgi:hypothetical protein